MYAKFPRGVILISTHRPPGRRAYSCAHEIGHHVFGHGTQVDEYLENAEHPERTLPEEWLVNCFAGFLLMPLPAIIHAFKRRAWSPATCTPLQAQIVAGNLGVGYGALLAQMSRTFNLFASDRYEQLRRTTPKEIRQQLLGRTDSPHLLIVDRRWNSKVAADAEVGDTIVLPMDAHVEGNVIKKMCDCEQGDLMIAVRPGIARVEIVSEDFATFIRVSRRAYTGRNMFRFLEDPDGNDLP